MVDEIITAYYQLDSEFGYDFVYNIDNTPKNDAEFKLHNHDNLYEMCIRDRGTGSCLSPPARHPRIPPGRIPPAGA